MDFLEDESSVVREKGAIKRFFNSFLNERTYYLYVVLFMVSMPIGEFVSEVHGVAYETQPVIHTFWGVVGLIMGFGWLLTNQEIKKWKKSDVFYWTLILFTSISLAFSNDIMESVNGYTYEEWFENFMGYFALMFSATHIENYKYRRRILYIFLGLALFESVICLFQSFGIRIMDSFLDSESHANENMTFGLTQHMNFYGGLSVLFFGASAGTFVFCKSKKISVYLGFLVALVFYGSLSTTARITWVGNFVVVLFLLISLLIVKHKKLQKENIKSYFSKFFILLAVVAVVIGIIMTTTRKLQSEFTQSVNEITNENVERLGSGRIYLWKYGFEALPDNWLTGVGLDNYKWCFYNSKNWDESMWFNHKAHNEYIHIMCTQGIPALVNYLLLLIYAVVTAVKNILKMDDWKNSIVTWIFLAMFAGYAAQAFVNSSIINVAMYFWITIGMVMPRNTQKYLTGKTEA